MWIMNDPEDFQRFKDDLLVVYQSHSIVIHAFCLMNNHVHLFMETPLGNLSSSMHRLFSRYASHFKKKYEHVGKVFEKRYKSFLVDTDDYALNLTRYIHRNPIDVIVSDPLLWEHSSYRIYQGFDSKPEFMDLDLVLKGFDVDKKCAASKMKSHMFHKDSQIWCPKDYILGNTILGSKNFVDRIKDQLPNEVHSELTGLIVLCEEDKVTKIKEYVSKLPLSIQVKINLLIYALRKRTSISGKKINEIIGTNLSMGSITYRVNKVLRLAKTDITLAKAVIDLNTL